MDKTPQCNIHIFLLFLGFVIKHCIVFEIFLQFSLPLSYTKLKLGKKFWIQASSFVCGVRGGVGPVWIGKRSRNAKVSQNFCQWLYLVGKIVQRADGLIGCWLRPWLVKRAILWNIKVCVVVFKVRVQDIAETSLEGKKAPFKESIFVRIYLR